jgi:peptidoglycan lytic transglycosylase
MPESLGYLEIGIASWYGEKFHGRLTANGETYNMYRLSAAHKTLPLPTIVSVTNLDNGRKTILRVNDRGPFHADRVIDLSYKAAMELGFADKGTAPVVVEAVDERNYPGGSLQKATGGSLSKAAEGSLSKAAEGSLHKAAEGSLHKAAEGSLHKAAEGSSFFLQAGAFSRVEGAEKLLRQIEGLLARHGDGIQVRILQSEMESGVLHKVWIGPIGTELEEERIAMLVAGSVAHKPIKVEID